MQDLCTKYSNSVAVVLCAGVGSRSGLGYNKILHSVAGVSVARRSVEKFLGFGRIIVVCRKDEMDLLREQIDFERVEFVEGGDTRSGSVRNALAVINSADIVAIHDGARPFVTDEIIDECVFSAHSYGSGVTAVKSTNALKLVGENGVATSLDRNSVFTVQTPQAFKFELIKNAYDTISGDYADDSEVFELAGYPVRLVNGSYDNIKLTTPADFIGLGGDYKIGFGFDVHPFKAGRDLILCGEKIDYEFGLDGHSDADAPVHAVMDAILSCLSLPDIGVLFPDNDDSYLGANSMKLLEKVVALATDYAVVNVSISIITQRPKLAPHAYKMRQNLANALGVSIDSVNISATTSEFLGITGDGRGLAVGADVLMKKIR
ncbi:MAG: 2-C-methyl-D-erythritol 2,4-cyclodiphosphate synthase [Clostridia bacterium]|nr:2-C-methyl-D-erythritol 2,4-cyclodiphosphate synthase [Clostridia bacterium]